MKIRLLAALSAVLLVLPAFPQTQTQPQTQPAAAEQNPRIPAIIHSLQKVRNIRETQLSPDGNLIAWAVSKEGIYFAPVSEPAEVRHIDTCEAPGDQHGSEAHAPGTKELIQVREGTIAVEVAGGQFTLGAGDAAAFPSDAAHGYANPGTRPARFSMAVFEPGVGHISTQEHGDA